MHARLCRRDPSPFRGRRFRPVYLSVIETTYIGSLVAAMSISSVHADGIKAEADPLDTEHLFGFTEGADIGPQGEKEFVIDSTLRDGRSTGSFTNTASQLELKYTAFQNLRISAGGVFAYYAITEVPGMEDARRAAVQSLFLDLRYRLLDRDHAPFGLTISAAPHWGFVDETSGVRAGHYGTEIELLADRELKRDWMVSAINVLVANDRERLLPFESIQHESVVGTGAGLAVQITPGTWLGGEARYLRDYGGPALNVLSGQALYIGPTLYARISGSAFVSAAWDFQVWGGATAAPGALDLTNFERLQAKLRFGFEF
jgi:hypothetical protein